MGDPLVDVATDGDLARWRQGRVVGGGVADVEQPSVGGLFCRGEMRAPLATNGQGTRAIASALPGLNWLTVRPYFPRSYGLALIGEC